MKKILFILFCSVAFIGASAQTRKGFRQMPDSFFQVR